ncbi:PD-(D/E)XK nuclease family protein [Rhodomicrobium lacus]|uniref:PDDEXK-like family protein n=1 Tax=Rhodomicrobium lacus TaxID=2498452 RepID=UPI0013E0B6B8|nr:PD-(D/E)XK nuclease family protein [Rhodomicrobium lacus]
MSDRSFDHDIRYYFDTASFLVKSAEDVDRQLSEKIGANFNLFDVFRLNYEIDISYILRNLLDPNGSHGQGARFLEAFLDQCNEQAPAIRGWAGDLSNVSVIPEFRTQAERRIDLVIKLPGDRYIGIENKPFSAEESEQLDDYATELDLRSENNFYLIYLCGHAGLPSTLKLYAWLKDDGQGERRFVDMRYNRHDEGPSLKLWATRCAQIADADKLRIFMRDFSEWLSKRFRELPDGGR